LGQSGELVKSHIVGLNSLGVLGVVGIDVGEVGKEDSLSVGVLKL
jgi:hypothetical protein